MDDLAISAMGALYGEIRLSSHSTPAQKRQAIRLIKKYVDVFSANAANDEELVGRLGAQLLLPDHKFSLLRPLRTEPRYVS